MSDFRLKSLLCCTTCTVLLAGCSHIETRPGHPESYDTIYYDESEKWSENSKEDKTDSSSASSRVSATIGVAPLFNSTRVPKEIWIARGVAWNKHLQYEAAAHKAQDIADISAIPLFGAAIAAAAVSVSHGSGAALTGSAVGGGAVGAVITYLHPEQDAATDWTAVEGLLCIVDKTAILRNMNAVPLEYDKAALEDALDQLDQDSAELMNLPTPNAAAQALQKIVTTVKNSGTSNLTNLETAIAAYTELQGVIYKAIDNVDLAAKSGSRKADYTAIVQEIEASAALKTANNTARTATDQATNQVASPAATTPATGKDETSHAINNVININVSNPPQIAGQLQNKLAADNVAPRGAPDPAANDAKDRLATVVAKGKALQTVFDQKTSNSMVKVNQLSRIAQGDLVQPSFQDIASQIEQCAAGGAGK